MAQQVHEPPVCHDPKQTVMDHQTADWIIAAALETGASADKTSAARPFVIADTVYTGRPFSSLEAVNPRNVLLVFWIRE